MSSIRDAIADDIREQNAEREKLEAEKRNEEAEYQRWLDADNRRRYEEHKMKINHVQEIVLSALECGLLNKLMDKAK